MNHGHPFVRLSRTSLRSLIASRFATGGWGATLPIHWTRDASRDIKPGCQDHHPAAIAPRPPPSGPRPTGRDARQLPRMCRRSRRWLSDTFDPPIDAVDRNSGLTRCRRWPTCWTSLRSGGTNCPPASRTAQRRKRSMPCWSCAVMSKIFRRPSCQKASDGTDGATGRPSAKCAGLATLGSSTQAFLKHVSFSVRWKRHFPAPAIYLPDAAQPRSRLGAPAPTAKRRGLDGGEHGVTLKRRRLLSWPGNGSFRGLLTAATWHQGEGAPRCPERGHHKRGPQRRK